MAEGLSIAASIAGLVTLADAVFVRAFQYIKDAKGAEKEVATLANELQSLSGVLHCLHLRINGLGGDKHDGTATCRPELVGSCLRLLVGLRDKLQEYRPGEHKQKVSGTMRKLKWPFSMTETKNLITDIERQKSTLTMALSVDNMAAAQKILSSQEKLLSGMEEIRNDLQRRQNFESSLTDDLMAAALDEKQKEVIGFFGTVDPRERYQTSRSLRYPNTGVWLLETDEFQGWLNKSSSRLWLSGIPGAGKTVLASAVIDSAISQCFNDSDKGVAYFYCDHKDNRSQKLCNILGSLAAQLATQNDQSLEILEKHYDMFHCPGKLPVNLVKPSLVQVIQEMSVYFTEVFVIVDALDECGQNFNVTTVVESLASLNTRDRCNIKTLFLSRDEYTISRCLKSKFVHIPIAARSHDLKLYVASQIETRMNSGRWRIKNPALKDEIMEKLVNGSGGMFRWVTCQIDRLGKLPHDTARRKALQDLPPDLDSTYERILSSVNENDECSRTLVQNTLRWIVLAEKPLRTEELCEALAIEDGSTTLDHDGIPDEEVILDLCSSLVRKSVSGDRLELSHFTVEEYLKSSRIRSNGSLAMYHIDPAIVALELSKKCMTYLNAEDFCQDLPLTKDVWQERHDIYPFRKHAVSYWHKYATEYANNFENDCFFGLCQTLFNPNESLNFLSYAQDAHLNAQYDGIWADLPIMDRTPLHYAALYHFVRLQHWLLSCGCDVNKVGPLGSPLHCALLGTESFALPNISFGFMSGGTISSEQMESISLLLHAGADWSIPLRDFENQSRSTLVTLLTFTDTKGGDKASLLKIFLDAGAILEESDFRELGDFYKDEKHEFNRIFKIVQRNHIQEASLGRFLDLASKMECYAPFSSSNIKYDPRTKLKLVNRNEAAARFRWAARVDQTDKMSSLLREQELDINSTTEYGEKTALHIALCNGSIRAVKLLLDAGADVNQPDCDGNTALHEYCLSEIKDPSIGSLLVRSGGIVGRQNKRKQTALDLAARENNVVVLRALLTMNEHEEGTLFASNCSRSALRYAVMYGSFGATALLINYVQDLNYPTAKGITLAHHCWKSSTKICRLLIERGLDVEAMTKAGESALSLFVSGVSLYEHDNEYFEVTMIQLLATAATINHPDSNGMTPAAILCSRGSDLLVTKGLAVFEELLKHGANITRTSSSEKAPLDILLSRKRDFFTSTLIERMVQYVCDACVIVSEDFWSKVLNWALHNKNWTLAAKSMSHSINASKHSGLRKILDHSIRIGDEDVCWDLVNSGFQTDLGHGGGSCCNAVILSLQRHKREFVSCLVRGGFSTDGEACCNNAYPGYTPIHLAVTCRKCCKILDLLLDVLPKDDFHMTAPVHPLHIAAARSNTAGIKCLLEHYTRIVPGSIPNSNVDKRDEENSSNIDPIFSDSRDHGISPIAKAIVNLHIRNSHLRRPWKLTGRLWTDGLEAATPLHLAALVSDIESAEVLLLYGADVHSLAGSNETPLHLAAGAGSLSMVRLLLRHGAKLDARNSTYRTPALVAAIKGHWVVFRELLEAGSDLSLTDEYDDGIAKTVLRWPSHKLIHDLYLENASAIDRELVPQTVYRSPLWWACGFPRPAFFSYLLNKKESQPDAESLSSVGGCRLITRNRHSLLRMLLKWLPKNCSAVESINERQPHGAHSPLCVAASVCNIDAMRLLLAFGADVDSESHDDGTPLMVACKAGHLRAVEFLVRQGARIAYCRGTEVYNAISHAERYPDIKAWLLVGRYTQQRKIDVAAEEDAPERVCQPWAGLVKVEVPLIARYGQFCEESLLQYVIRLAQYKRDFEGHVLRWGNDVRIPFITLSL